MDQDLIRCTKGCGNRLHEKCMAVWARERRRLSDKIQCPLCRIDWDVDPTAERQPTSRTNLLAELSKGKATNNSVFLINSHHFKRKSHPRVRQTRRFMERCLLNRCNCPSRGWLTMSSVRSRPSSPSLGKLERLRSVRLPKPSASFQSPQTACKFSRSLSQCLNKLSWMPSTR